MSNEIDEAIERKLWILEAAIRPRHEWESLLNYLLIRLNNFLGITFEIVTFVDGPFLASYAIQTKPVSRLHMEFAGGINIVIRPDYRRVYSLLFPSLLHERIVVAPLINHVVLDYSLGKSTTGQWSTPKWTLDEYGEY